MSQFALIYRILVASPSDCIDERRIIQEVIYGWNAANSLARGAILEPVLWETHAIPELGERGQEVLNTQLIPFCDILIGVFSSRLGTPTGCEESGTVEEIEKFKQEGKPVMLYFSTIPLDRSRLDIDQLNALNNFKERMKVEGLYLEFESKEKFRTMLNQNLSKAMNDVLSGQAAVPNVHFELAEAEEHNEINYLKDDFNSFHVRLEAEWANERDTNPNGIDDAKYILEKAHDYLLDLIAKKEIQEYNEFKNALEDNLKELKMLSRHEIFADGGKSWRAFWDAGDLIIKSIRETIVFPEKDRNKNGEYSKKISEQEKTN